jgi:FlaA1/EpsC-like NDP-sugar epimerase
MLSLNDDSDRMSECSEVMCSSDSMGSVSPVDSLSEADSFEENEQASVAHTDKKTVLVTGVAGFIGSSVAEALLARGDDVVGVDEVRVTTFLCSSSYLYIA